MLYCHGKGTSSAKVHTNTRSGSFCWVFELKQQDWVGKAHVGSSSLTRGALLSTQFMEWDRKTNREGSKNLFQRPSKSYFLLPCALFSQSLLIILVLPLLYFLQNRPKKKGQGMVYLTLICPVVSFREMTCYLRGKGQLFCFALGFFPSSSESQFTDPRLFSVNLWSCFSLWNVVLHLLSWILCPL